MEKFRNTKDIKYIYKKLATASNSKTILTLWQNVNDERNIITAYVKSINIIDRKMILMPISKKVEFEFEQGVEFYIKSKDNVYTFKCKLDYLSSKVMSLYLPDEMYIIELREHARQEFDIMAGNVINIDFLNKLTHLPQAFAFPIQDLSLSGAGIIVSSNQIAYLKKGMVGAVKKIGRKEFQDEALEGEIVYILPLGLNLRVNGLHSYRIGLMFSRNLESNIFDFLEK